MPKISAFPPAILFFCLLAPCLTPVSAESGHAPAQAMASTNTEVRKEEKLLGFLIKQQLEHRHFIRTEKLFNDQLSMDAFGQLLKRVDPQKRLLLKDDVTALAVHKAEMDDELQTGNYVLPFQLAGILEKNIKMIEAMTIEILAEKFDFSSKEDLETDPDKIDYCANREALKDRWRKHLKYQCLNRILGNVIQDEGMEDAEESPIVNPGKEFSANVAMPSANLAVAAGNTQSAGNTAVASGNAVKKAEPQDPMVQAKDKVHKNLELYFKRMHELTRQDHFSNYYNSITTTFDPHTDYMDPESKQDFDIHMKKSLEGIGAVLQETDDGFTKVVRIVPGSASARQGELEAEDIILRVGQSDDRSEDVDITGLRVREVVKFIRGPKGSIVRLTTKKTDGTIKVIPIERDIVKLEDALAKSTILPEKKSGKDIGYIYLPDFYRDFTGATDRSATKDVTDELKKLTNKGIQGLIFDLRNNGGGALEDARSIAGLFIERGPIVQVKNSYGMVRVLYDEDRNIAYEGPLVILVNQFSASASEIFAAAMQDYGRAVVVGPDQTHGKGTVQQLIPLDNMSPQGYQDQDMGSLKLTIQKFYRVTGSSTQQAGVASNVVLPDEKTYLKSGERHLDFALPFDTIPAVRYSKWPHPPDMRNIQLASAERVAKNQVFRLIEDRYKILKEKYDKTIVSLNMDIVKKELDDNKNEVKRFNKIMKDISDRENEKDTPEEEKRIAALPFEEKEHIKWTKSLAQDPYVKESMAILVDMNHQLAATK